MYIRNRSAGPPRPNQQFTYGVHIHTSTRHDRHGASFPSPIIWKGGRVVCRKKLHDVVKDPDLACGTRTSRNSRHRRESIIGRRMIVVQKLCRGTPVYMQRQSNPGQLQKKNGPKNASGVVCIASQRSESVRTVAVVPIADEFCTSSSHVRFVISSATCDGPDQWELV